MKKIKILFIFLLLLNGCSKDDNSGSNENIEEQTIEGRIILPDGNKLDINQLSVQSYIDNSSIDSNMYSISIPIEEHNFTFVSDINEKVILMGYNYPNQKSFDLNAESTVIALAMTLPITSMMSDDAKTNFVTKLKQNVNFPTVVENMEQLVIQGISPLDINQTTFLNNFLSMFSNSLSNKNANSKGNYNSEPVNVFTAGNKITFQNGGKLYETSVGVYKDNERIEHIELDRIKFFANSASEALNIVNNLGTEEFAGGEVIEKTYEFKDNGDYEIKIRTGFGNEVSYESNEARFDNISKWSMDFVLTLLPLKGKLECTQEILKEIRTYTVVAMDGKSVNTLSDALTTSYDISKSVVDLLKANLQCFAKNPENIKFLSLVKKVFGWTSWVSRTGTGGNIILGISQWAYDDSSIDLCYQVNETNIVECQEKLSNSIKIITTDETLDYSSIPSFIETFGVDKTVIVNNNINGNATKIINIYLIGQYINSDGTYTLAKNSFNEDENFTVQFLDNSFSKTNGFVVLDSGTLTISDNLTKFDFEGIGYILDNPNDKVNLRGNVTIN